MRSKLPEPFPEPPALDESAGGARPRSRTTSVQKKYTARYIQVLEAAAHEFSSKGYHVATTAPPSSRCS